jgi:ABC-type multidrug transport system fused ATPase/permease subunit
VAAAAFVGAVATVALVVALARQGPRMPVVPLVLAGVVVGSSLSAGTSFVLLAAREQAAGVLAWLLGSFAFASWDRLAWALPAGARRRRRVLLAARALDVLQLGDAAAAQLGPAVEPLKVLVVVASTLATAAAVASAGVIGFVGLVVPHAVRLAVGPAHRRLLPLAALWGATFVVLADLIARTVIAPAEVPVGVVTALGGRAVLPGAAATARRSAAPTMVVGSGGLTELHAVVVAGYGDRRVLHGVTSSCGRARSWALVGPNGAGKSTLVAVASRWLVPRRGEVRLDGRPLRAYGRRALARASPWCAGGELPEGFTVDEVVGMGRTPPCGLPAGTFAAGRGRGRGRPARDRRGRAAAPARGDALRRRAATGGAGARARPGAGGAAARRADQPPRPALPGRDAARRPRGGRPASPCSSWCTT